MINPFSLDGKIILVTGASSGIGRGIAIECSKMGAKLIITGRNEVRLHETFTSLNGQDHIELVADLLSYEDIKKLINLIPKIDGFVSNAGIIKPKVIQMSKKEDVYETFDINTNAPIFLTQQLVQNKKINKNASMVYVSSISGVKCGSIGRSLYGASKAALNGFIKGLALELANRGIRVNTVNPGMVNTSLLDASLISEEELKEDIDRYPLKRYGNPDDIAFAVIYLLSDASAWVTGSNLLIDGGYTLL